jgi:hypothetical protein
MANPVGSLTVPGRQPRRKADRSVVGVSQVLLSDGVIVAFGHNGPLFCASCEHEW